MPKKERESKVVMVGIPKISIIVPIYKAEKTIHKCLDSIARQTLEEWEAILVDDGSPDTCGQICDEYAAKDSRFHVVHQSNQGVSTARQVGLEAAVGDFVIHVDPDDWVEPMMLEDMYKRAVDDNADMLICDFYKDYDGGASYQKQVISSFHPEKIMDDIFKGVIHGSCCNKLVRHSCILQYGAKFPPGINYCEDICFLVQLLKHSLIISYMNRAYYHYVQLPTSITGSFNEKKFGEVRSYIAFLCSFFPEDSYPVMRAKEWLKKEAFRNGIVSLKEVSRLYPEIKRVEGEGAFKTLMYYCAFNGHHYASRFLLFIYNFKRKL